MKPGTSDRARTLAWMPRSTRCWLAERSKSPRIRLCRIRENAIASYAAEVDPALREALRLEVGVVEGDRVDDVDAADVLDHRLEELEPADEDVVGLDADEVADGLRRAAAGRRSRATALILSRRSRGSGPTSRAGCRSRWPRRSWCSCRPAGGRRRGCGSCPRRAGRRSRPPGSRRRPGVRSTPPGPVDLHERHLGAASRPSRAPRTPRPRAPGRSSPGAAGPRKRLLIMRPPS